MSKIAQSIFGIALVAAGIWLVYTGERSDWLVVALVGFGAHFVSKSLLRQFLSQVLRFLRRPAA